jgi:hypothetical protein
MNSYFIQRDGGRLYGTTKMSQQKYGVEFVPNESKSYVTNLKQIFHA